MAAKGCLTVVGIAVLFGAGMGLISAIDSPAPGRPFDPSRPESIVNEVPDSARRTATASFNGGVLQLTYSIDPWALTAGAARDQFYLQATKLIPKAFTAGAVLRFCDVVTATFKDVYGHDSRLTAGIICLNKATAAKVNWPEFDSDNLPRIADEFFLHPGFAK